MGFVSGIIAKYYALVNRKWTYCVLLSRATTGAGLWPRLCNKRGTTGLAGGWLDVHGEGSL
jgi:hypothetical protein